jgi:hypothetical protein
MATTSTKDKTCYKINDGTQYALLEIPADGSSFTLTPTDSTYTPITLNVIDGSYAKLYNRALAVYAQYVGAEDSSTKGEVEERYGWVEDSTEINIVHPGGTYTVSPSVEKDVFDASKYSLLEYLNQKIDDKS